MREIYDHPTSTTIIQFLSQFMSNPRSLEDFWETIEDKGAPLIEPAPNREDHHLVTFIFRSSSARRVEIVSYLTGAKENTLENIPGTDIWHRSLLVRNDIRSTYSFRVSESAPEETQETDPLRGLVIDPLNPDIFPFYTDSEDPTEIRFARSILKMPGALDHPWSKLRPMASHSDLTESVISSAILGNERRIWVYAPKSDRPNSANEYNCLIIFDGWGHLNLIPARNILDNLHAAAKIRPTIAVFVDSLDMDTRMQELLFYEPFNRFLIDELLPFIRRRYSITSEPDRTALSGASAGGMAAFYAAMRHPHIFGCVLAQSPALAFSPPEEPEPEWLRRQLARNERSNQKIYFDAGILESNSLHPSNSRPSLLSCAWRLRDVLRNKGYAFKYIEFPGGHDYISWEGTFPEGLIYLFSE